MSSQTPINGLPLRRNGKPQSCEPCRKAKSACDHKLPSCRRCIQRDITVQCIYHPAPLTRPLASPTDISRVQKKSKTASNAAAAARFQDHQCSAIKTNLLSLLSKRADAAEGFEMLSSEFLGPTSYFAVFRENQANFGEDLLNTHQDDEAASQMSTEHEQWWTVERLSLGSGLLKHFPDRKMCERALDGHAISCDVDLHIPSLRYCVESIWSTYGSLLAEPRSPENVTIMAKSLLKNGLTTVRSCRTTAEWLESFTGEKLRWEILGTFFAIFGLYVMSMRDWNTDDSLDSLIKDKRTWVRKLTECAEACLILCDESGCVNEFVIWLMHHIDTLNTFYSGDASRLLWRRHGAVASAITSLGLHRGSDTSNSPSFMVAELRRRIFSAAFIQDKQLATFTGRPPALSRRYSNCQIPLDLSDEDLMAEGQELAEVLGKLDANGWNTTTQKTPATCVRAWMLVALIRDEILEISLGPNAESCQSRRDDVKRRSEETYANLPSYLHLQSEEVSFKQLPHAFATSIMLNLEFLLNKFLLERLPGDGSPQNSQNLLDTAKQMLDRIMLLSSNRDRLVDHQVGFAWAVVYIGIPSAGVLSVELLKQSKYPLLYPLVLPRSEIIQNLSLFIGCLGSIRPTQGTYILCVRMRKVIRRILDRVLEPVSIVDPMLTPTSTEVHDFVPHIDISSVVGPTDDPDFTEWLHSVDWTIGPLVDSY